MTAPAADLLDLLDVADSRSEHEALLELSRRAHASQVEVFETQKHALQRLLNRLERLVRPADVAAALAAALLPELPPPPLPPPMTTRLPVPLLADAGLSIVRHFVLETLDAPPAPAGGDCRGMPLAASLSSDPEDLFVPFLNVADGYGDGDEDESLQCRLLCLLPALFAREEQLRKDAAPRTSPPQPQPPCGRRAGTRRVRRYRPPCSRNLRRRGAQGPRGPASWVRPSIARAAPCS